MPDNKELELFVITSPDNFLDEEKYISYFLDQGANGIYLRKATYSREYFVSVFKHIHPDHYNKMILPFSAMGESFLQNTKPVFHIKEDERELLNPSKLDPDAFFSTSIHDIAEWEKLSPRFKYAFYSPVFKSISKDDYVPSKTFKELADKIKKYRNKGKKLPCLIALGGVNDHNINTLAEGGFDGAALFGSIWESLFPEKTFMKIKGKLDHLSHPPLK